MAFFKSAILPNLDFLIFLDLATLKRGAQRSAVGGAYPI